MPKKKRKKISLLSDLNIKGLSFINLFYATLIINGVNLAYVFLIQKRLQPEVPLFYGLPEGQEQLTTPLNLAIPALISFAVALVNFAICLVVKNKFFQQVLIAAAFVVSVFSIITIVKITLLIGSF